MLLGAARSANRKAIPPSPAALPFIGGRLRGSAMRNDFYVYVHSRSTDGRPFYVGKGSGKRATIYAPSKRNPFWQNVAQKHGVDCEIVASGMQEDAAFELESFLIAELRSHGIRLTNLTDGGDGPSGYVMPPENRRHLSLKLKGNMPEGHGKWMSEVNRARHSDPEYRARVYPKLRGQKRTEKTRMLLKELATGRKQSPEAIEKTRQAVIKRHADPEFIKVMKSASPNSKEVSCSNGMIFRNGHDAAEWLRSNGHPKAAASPISKCARGKCNSAYGFSWEYTGKTGKLNVEDYEKCQK